MMSRSARLFLAVVVCVSGIAVGGSVYYAYRLPRPSLTPPPAVAEPTNTPVVSPLTIIRLASSTFSASVEYSAEPQPVSAWQTGGDEVIINGGYFNPDFTPSGYLVAQGKRIGKLLFDQDKSGLIGIRNGTFFIRDLHINPLMSGETFDGAVQSYPFLIRNSKPDLSRDTNKIARRTALGIDADGNVYIIALTSTELSLYQFMREIEKTGIPFIHVLNLDGGPSTGIMAVWGSSAVHADSFVRVPSIIRFKKR